jgi:hypothetical protein
MSDVLQQAVVESRAHKRQAGFKLRLAGTVIVLRPARLPRVDATPVQTPNSVEDVVAHGIGVTGLRVG